ncbi:uncharacterized protein FSUBG_3337 [Fusarium subglutinans]|uniref:Uncharacterized protein n=1 Tax=Gibberella subglutinans TaxID=42677 RepID=A0A8H5Q5S2_GIBSU|nr:uncharacterized protein FSUBG_3337 [Fusarium subglutinans]KAF5610105.1 hypothetical protein FSUBG_3337 [Fusarium subglutinans]
MAAEKPSKQAGEILSKEVNGRRFTFRFRDSDGSLRLTDERWLDEDGNSIEWWEKKSLLRDWIYGRMSPEEFDTHFPYYSGSPKEWYRIEKETHAMPQQEKEPSEPKESDETCTQRYAERYGDGSGLPLRPGMGPPMTDEEFQESEKEMSLIRDRVPGHMSAEEFDARFPTYTGPKYEFSREKEDASDVRSSHSDESYDEWGPEAYFQVMDSTDIMLRHEYYACLYEDDGDIPRQPSIGPSKAEGGLEEEPMKEDDKEKPRYAQHYGDGSGLPLRPGMGPPMTKEEQEESWKEWQAESKRLWNMTDEEFYAQYPEYKATKDHRFAEGEAEEWSGLPLRPGMGPPPNVEEDEESLKKLRAEYDEIMNMSEEEFNAEFPEYKALKDEELLEGNDDEQPRYAHRFGDGSGLPLRPGMGPPKTKEEFEEEYKKIEAEEDKIFNMSEEEFNAKFPEYKDMPKYSCTDHESWRIMEECDKAEGRNHFEGKE